MNRGEYLKLERLDARHWFYSGKRRIVHYWMRRFISLHDGDLYIDAGCGTGRMLVEMSKVCCVLGLDNSQESIDLCRQRVRRSGGWVASMSLNATGLRSSCAAVVTLLDVLEHVDDDDAVLEEMIRLVRPGGLIIITVPAMSMLWSDWDVALHHRRRYSKDGLLRLLSRPEVEVLRCTYFNSLLLPLILAVRMWRRISPVGPEEERAEDRLPGRFLNAVLAEVLVLPALCCWFRPPLGVSLLAILRRSASGSAPAIPT